MDGSKESSRRGWRNSRLGGEKKTFPERLFPTVILTLIAPGSPSSPQNLQLLSASHVHLPPQTQTLFLILSPKPHPGSSKLLPTMLCLLLLEKLNLVSPGITDNIYEEAKVKFSLLSQGLLSWLCKQYGI